MDKEKNYNSPAKLLQEMINYIEIHLMDKSLLTDLSKTFYISTNVLNQMFRIICGMTITEYVKNRKLSLAACDLRDTGIHIIDIAFKYGYETPEAFTKAFTRFYGFPPSFVRRTNPELKQFYPLQIRIDLHGGWEEAEFQNQQIKRNDLTNPSVIGQENIGESRYHICTETMNQKEDWAILIRLVQKLQKEEIHFKVDGKTLIFAHGLEFKLDKICLTFPWKEEKKVLQFFHGVDRFHVGYQGFRYWDTVFEGMPIRCMQYEVFQGMDELEALYKDTDLVEVDRYSFHVQSLEFYYQNAQKEEPYYSLVEDYLKAEE